MIGMNRFVGRVACWFIWLGLCVSTAKAEDRIANFHGTYVCGQGATEVSLDVYRALVGSPEMALFSFGPTTSNPNVPHGSFLMRGTVDLDSGRMNFAPFRWVNQPFGFTMVGMIGSSSNGGTVIEGRILGVNCTRFAVSRTDVAGEVGRGHSTKGADDKSESLSSEASFAAKRSNDTTNGGSNIESVEKGSGNASYLSFNSQRIGPSFDCHKIGVEAIASVICSSEKLSEEDVALSEAYYALRGTIGTTEQLALKQEARDKNRLLKQACEIPDRLPLPREPSTYVDCVFNGLEHMRESWFERLSGLSAMEASRQPEDHMALQRALQSKGYLENNVLIDGVYGTGMRSAIGRWQSSIGDQVTGFFNSDEADRLLGRAVKNIERTASQIVPQTPSDAASSTSAALQQSAPPSAAQDHLLERSSEHESAAVERPTTSPAEQTGLNSGPGSEAGPVGSRVTTARSQPSDVSGVKVAGHMEQPTTEIPDSAHQTRSTNEVPQVQADGNGLNWPVIAGLASVALVIMTVVLIVIKLRGVKRASADMAPIELWSLEVEDVNSRVIDWLCSGPLGYVDRSKIIIEEQSFWVLPIMNISCVWRADWWGQIGRVDQGSLNNAINIYRMAKLQYDQIPREERYRHKEPIKPEERNHVLWSDGNGSVGGTIRWQHVFIGNLVAVNTPREFGTWATHLANGVLEDTPELMDWTEPYHAREMLRQRCRLNINIIQPVDHEAITRSLQPQIDDTAQKNVGRDTPKYSNGIRFETFVEWKDISNHLFPMFTLKYVASGKSYVCAVDGLSGMLFHGQKARDIHGTLSRAWSDFIKKFRKTPPKLLSAPVKLLAAPKHEEEETEKPPGEKPARPQA